MEESEDKLYIVLLSIHGLIRGHDLELGRDADTGGQTKYVVELARALGEHPRVAQVDLLTRCVVDPRVASDYAKPVEALNAAARIVRIPCGEAGYLPKEELWDHLESFVDNALQFLNEQDSTPHLIHSHYADGGYVGIRIAGQLGVPLVHTGHSLGRVKRRRLLASGMDRNRIESQFKITRRIAAEEDTLGAADLVITSTQQEVESQYELYDYYRPDQMKIIPPGVDLESFYPPRGDEREEVIYGELERFFQHPEKPIVLALSRPDRRKNIEALVDTYGQSPRLQECSNLVVVAGNRTDLQEMDDGPRRVLGDLLFAIDRHDLYGHVAYPKHHQPDDVSVLYRLAAMSQGVFVNPALTEPFGLTLLEAAASGLPVVATDDGGPTDIIKNCGNGFLIDPLDTKNIETVLLDIMQDSERWRLLASNGLDGVRRHYSWTAHTDAYIAAIEPLVAEVTAGVRQSAAAWSGDFRDRAIFSDLDQSLLGDPEALEQLIDIIRANRKRAAFGIVTGRRLDSALTVMRKHRIPQPDVLITSLGTDIYYAPNLTRDTHWRQHIDHLWNPRAIRRILADLPGLKRQPTMEHGVYKVSYYYDPREAPTPGELSSLLLQNEQPVNLAISFGQFLDIVPIRASKGTALRWYAAQRNVPLENILVAGGSGADEDMMLGNTLAVVVANRHDEELSDLAEVDRIYFADRPWAAGIIDAIEHYDFFGSIRSQGS